METTQPVETLREAIHRIAGLVAAADDNRHSAFDPSLLHSSDKISKQIAELSERCNISIADLGKVISLEVFTKTGN